MSPRRDIADEPRDVTGINRRSREEVEEVLYRIGVRRHRPGCPNQTLAEDVLCIPRWTKRWIDLLSTVSQSCGTDQICAQCNRVAEDLEPIMRRVESLLDEEGDPR